MLKSLHFFRHRAYLTRRSPLWISVEGRRRYTYLTYYDWGTPHICSAAYTFSSRSFHSEPHRPQTARAIPFHATKLTCKSRKAFFTQRKVLLAELERSDTSSEVRMPLSTANLRAVKYNDTNDAQKTMIALSDQDGREGNRINRENENSHFACAKRVENEGSDLSPRSETKSLSLVLCNKSLGKENFQANEDASLNELEAQQSVLRETFDYAFKHHRIRLRKDSNVYRRECRVYRQSHPQMKSRLPTTKEVSPCIDVTLPSVSALHALRHLHAKNSSIYSVVQRALLLQQSVMKNQLMLSNQRTLVRCLRCFHVYSAQPRTLWGTQPSSQDGVHVQHSWQSYELELKKTKKINQLKRAPYLRKKLYSVGRQQANFADRPTCCPFCTSKKAQWAMEYVHNRTHAHFL